MTETSRTAYLAPDTETETLASYRSVSRWAVVSFVLGIASWAALASPIFWLLPLGTICVGVIALRRVGTPALNLAGRPLAIIGLALAIFFGATATTRSFSRHAALVNDAIEHSNRWLQLISEGALPAAHQLTLLYYNRVSEAADLREVYSEDYIEPNAPEGAVMPGTEGLNFQSMNTFFEQPPISLIAQHRGNATWELVGIESVQQRHSATKHSVVVHYLLKYPDGNETKTVPIYVTMERDYYPVLSEAHWKVDSVTPETDLGS